MWHARECDAGQQGALNFAGHADVKAIVDQEIAQEIARLEAKLDAVISKYTS